MHADDADGAHPLTFEEFFAVQPLRVRQAYPANTIKDWFEAAAKQRDSGADAGSAVVSLNTFFLFTLSEEALVHGAASLQDAFSEFDNEPAYMGRGGLLDLGEFEEVAEAMGFKAQATAIFRSLDKDHSGEIGYEELTEAIETDGCSDITLDAKLMLIALAWTSVSVANRLPAPSTRQELDCQPRTPRHIAGGQCRAMLHERRNRCLALDRSRPLDSPDDLSLVGAVLRSDSSTAGQSLGRLQGAQAVCRALAHHGAGRADSIRGQGG